MFQDFNKLWGQPFSQQEGPLKGIVEIQTRMLEKLASQQMQCTQACIQTAVEQSKALQSCSSANDVLAVQQAYVAALEANISKVTQANLEALNTAREALESLTLDTLSNSGDGP